MDEQIREPGEYDLLSLDDEAYPMTKKSLSHMRVFQSFKTPWAAKLEIDYDIDYNEMVHRIVAYVQQEHIAKEHYEDYVIFETPSTTWQMFKAQHMESWWMRWFIKRFPIKSDGHKVTVQVKVDRYLNYPDSTVVFNDLGRPRIYETADVRRAVTKL